MSNIEHWIATAPKGTPSFGQVVCWNSETADEYRSMGWTVEGPFAPSTTTKGAVGRSDVESILSGVEAHYSGRATAHEVIDVIRKRLAAIRKYGVS